ncbi:MAG: CoA ester lyase [Frankiales bacterium]|nr:CoA ester lyase [Frankiales bacterium]
MTSIDAATRVLTSARSWLFVPGDRPDRFPKAIASGADVVVLDLEDAVAADQKTAARTAVATWLDPAHPVVVRVNAVPEMLSDDLAALRRPGLLAVMLPKSDEVAGVAAVGDALPAGVAVVPLIETAAGICALAEVTRARCVVRLAFGGLDLAVDLDVEPGVDGGVLTAAGHQVVLHSAAAGLAPPIAGVTTQLHDADQLQADLAAARRDGFGGKLCIHPSHVDPVNRAFAPTPEQREWARRVLATAATESGVFRLDGQMVDRPVIERARRVLGAGGLGNVDQGDDRAAEGT